MLKSWENLSKFLLNLKIGGKILENSFMKVLSYVREENSGNLWNNNEKLELLV